MKRLQTALIVFAAAVCAAVPAWGCPSCNRAIEGDPVALSFYWSTLFMIAMPYLLFTTVGGGIAYFYWSAARKAARTETIDTMMWSTEGTEKEGGR